MGSSFNHPKTWVPYMNTKDCSQGFCSLYCPQWCYIIFPPPPPFTFPDVAVDDDASSPSFSPLVIAIIGILASAFLLVSYYAIISKYCGNSDSPSSSRRRRRRRENDEDPDDEFEENQDPSNHEQPWQGGQSNGLDESLIKSMAVFKYKNGGDDDDDGMMMMVGARDCSVCLSEFQVGESLRILPKCTHAFHVSCIDAWLKCHSNCPLCRGNIVFFNTPPQIPPQPPLLLPEAPDHEGGTGTDSSAEDQNGDVGVEEEDGERGNKSAPPLSHLGVSEGRDTIIEIREEEEEEDGDGDGEQVVGDGSSKEGMGDMNKLR